MTWVSLLAANLGPHRRSVKFAANDRMAEKRQRIPPLAVANWRPFVRSSLWAAGYMPEGSGV
jgi:hypothetical protein